MADEVFSTPFEGTGQIQVEKKDEHYYITQGGMPVADSTDPDEIISGMMDILTKVITGAHTHVTNLEAQLQAIRELNGRVQTSGHFPGAN